MKPGTQFVLLCYDIVDNKRRAKLQKVADAFGERVNDSVYECWLNPTQEASLVKKVKRLVNEREDAVYFYRLCAACLQRKSSIGLHVETQPERVRIV
ncbi:MAG: hypothetical protein AMXMBFR61_08420 [Fimbriimonadales bacterium]